MKSDILADVKEYYQSKVVKYLLQYALIVVVAILFYMLNISLADSKWSNKEFAIFVIIGSVGLFIFICVKLLTAYTNLMKSIKGRHPTETEQIELVHDFQEAYSVFFDEMRIGKDYTFIANDKGCWIIDTHKIVDFIQLEKHVVKYGTIIEIYVIVDSESVTQTRSICVRDNATKANAEEQIQEAKSVLRQMQEGSGRVGLPDTQ